MTYQTVYIYCLELLCLLHTLTFSLINRSWVRFSAEVVVGILTLLARSARKAVSHDLSRVVSGNRPIGF